MNQPARAQEPSMEEILASIRRIIADDDASKAPEGAAAESPPPRRGWRRRRFGGCTFGRLARIVIGDNAPNGGENLLHRRFLRSRRLVHTRPHLRSQRA